MFLAKSGAVEFFKITPFCAIRTHPLLCARTTGVKFSEPEPRTINWMTALDQFDCTSVIDPVPYPELTHLCVTNSPESISAHLDGI